MIYTWPILSEAILFVHYDVFFPLEKFVFCYLIQYTTITLGHHSMYMYTYTPYTLTHTHSHTPPIPPRIRIFDFRKLLGFLFLVWLFKIYWMSMPPLPLSKTMLCAWIKGKKFTIYVLQRLSSEKKYSNKYKIITYGAEHLSKVRWKRPFFLLSLANSFFWQRRCLTSKPSLVLRFV